MTKLTLNSLQKYWIGFAFLCVGLIYFLYLPVNYDFDGTVFSQYLRYGLVNNDSTFIHHPQHPLYMPFNYYLYKALNALTGYNVLEYFHLQLSSFIFGLLTLFFSYKILSKITVSRFYQVSGVLLAALSYCLWYYSVEAEVHMPGLFFITAGFYLLFYKEGNPFALSRILLTVICFVAAAGFHLTNGLIVFSIFFIFIIEKQKFSNIFKFYALYSFFLAVGLVFFGWLIKLNLLKFYLNQLKGNDPLAGYTIVYSEKFTWSGIRESFRTISHAWVFPVSSLFEYVVLGLFIAGLVFVLWKCFKNKDPQHLTRFGLWMLPYMIFFSVWNPRNVEFKLNIIFPFILLFIATLSVLPARKTNPWVWILILVILGTGGINFYYSILPSNDISRNTGYMMAEAVKNVTEPGSIVVIAGCGSEVSTYGKIYFPYFALRKTLFLDWVLGHGSTLEQFGNQLYTELKKGTAVYLFSEILEETEALKTVFKNHQISKEEYFRFLGSLKLGERKALPGGYYLERLHLP